MRLASEVSGDGQLCPLDEIFSCVVRKEGLLKKQGRSAANTPTPRQVPQIRFGVSPFLSPLRDPISGGQTHLSRQ